MVECSAFVGPLRDSFERLAACSGYSKFVVTTSFLDLFLFYLQCAENKNETLRPRHPKERPKQARSRIWVCGIMIGTRLSIPFSGDDGGRPCCRLGTGLPVTVFLASRLSLVAENASSPTSAARLLAPTAAGPSPSCVTAGLPNDSCEHRSILRNRSLCAGVVGQFRALKNKQVSFWSLSFIKRITENYLDTANSNKLYIQSIAPRAQPVHSVEAQRY